MFFACGTLQYAHHVFSVATNTTSLRSRGIRGKRNASTIERALRGLRGIQVSFYRWLRLQSSTQQVSRVQTLNSGLFDPTSPTVLPKNTIALQLRREVICVEVGHTPPDAAHCFSLDSAFSRYLYSLLHFHSFGVHLALCFGFRILSHAYDSGLERHVRRGGFLKSFGRKLHTLHRYLLSNTLRSRCGVQRDDDLCLWTV